MSWSDRSTDPIADIQDGLRAAKRAEWSRILLPVRRRRLLAKYLRLKSDHFELMASELCTDATDAERLERWSEWCLHVAKKLERSR